MPSLFSKPPTQKAKRNSTSGTPPLEVTPANFWQTLKTAAGYDASILTEAERSQVITGLLVFEGCYRRHGNQSLEKDINSVLKATSETGNFVKAAMASGIGFWGFVFRI